MRLKKKYNFSTNDKNEKKYFLAAAIGICV